jgi:hypothetical protein
MYTSSAYLFLFVYIAVHLLLLYCNIAWLEEVPVTRENLHTPRTCSQNIALHKYNCKSSYNICSYIGKVKLSL